MKKLINKLLNKSSNTRFPYLEKHVIEINNYLELKKLFGWKNDPIIKQKSIFDFEYPEDLNERRIRDAESLGTVLRNINPNIVLEIGTSFGHGTAHIADNCPNSIIYTVNIPPDDYKEGEGGKHITHILESHQIGSYYRNQGYKNINQILANTKFWKPDIGTVDFAFIDGSHDFEFVVSDTLKILEISKPGTFILWHDFNPGLSAQYSWINNVLRAVNELYRMKKLNKNTYHLKDSWIGIYQV